MSRKRLTNRQASPPPASYGWEPDHPAYKADPEADAYENGDTSSWAEDPTSGPYPNGPPPADPGYQDEPSHPAAKKARDLRASVERKAGKCIRIAQSMLGPNATTEEVEDQALDLMDLPDRQINASLNRIRTAFLTAEEEEADEMVDEAMLAEFLADSEDPTVNTAESEDPSGIMAELESMKAELEAMRGGDQNDPEGDILAPDAAGLVPDSSEEMIVEEGPMADMGQDEASDLDVDAKMGEDEKSAHSIFDLYDVDGDGFITAEEWGGSPSVFEALDTDGDGILSRDEISMGLGDGMTASSEEEADDDGSEAMLAAMLAEEEKKSCGEGVTASDMKTELDAVKAELDALKLATKSGESEEKAKKDEEEGEEEAAKTVQEEVEEGAEEADKEASDELVMTADVHDPMGLSADGDIDEDTVLAELFGKSAKAGEDKEEKEEHDEGAVEDDEDHIEDLEEDKDEEEKDLKKEEKKASLRPQAKKESSGVKSLGAVSKTASSDVNELSKLWQSAPDVSSIFGV